MLERNFVKTFESYVEYALYEATNLNQMGLPQGMIKAIMAKPEHISDKHPLVGHTFRSGSPVPLLHKYFQPGVDIEIPEPVELTGNKTQNTPYSLDTDAVRRSDEPKPEDGRGYLDVAWFLRSIPRGECRVFIVHPKSNFFMFIYDKQATPSATGSQYGMMGWDPAKNKLVDYGHPELVIQAVDSKEIRDVHDNKGGNTSGKVEEYIVTRTAERVVKNKELKTYKLGTYEWAKANEETIEKPATPILAYILDIDSAPRDIRTTRQGVKGDMISHDILRVYAEKLSRIVTKLKPNQLEKLQNEISNTVAPALFQSWPEIPALVNALFPDQSETSDYLSNKVEYFLFSKFRDFRNAMYEEGRYNMANAKSAYETTSGYDLEKENSIFQSGQYYTSQHYGYEVEYKTYTPGQDVPDVYDIDPETGQEIRNAKAERHKVNKPTVGNYAEIRNMIKQHTPDGLFGIFLYYLITGSVKSPKQNFGALFSGGDTASKASPKFKNPGEEDKSSDTDDLFAGF